jgi:hypothetical protein
MNMDLGLIALGAAVIALAAIVVIVLVERAKRRQRRLYDRLTRHAAADRN